LSFVFWLSVRLSDADIFLRVFYLKLLPSLRTRRTCHRSSFIHCRYVRAVFFITPRFFKHGGNE
jgi:hypothetical protein